MVWDTVLIVVIDAFDDVEFARVGPITIGTVNPESRPSSLPKGEVNSVEDEESVAEWLLWRNTDRGAQGFTVEFVGRVYRKN